MRLIAILRRARLRADDGYTMLITLTSLAVISAASAAAFAATTGDVRQATKDVQRKQAYAAAEAGLQNYGFKLARNPDYWTLCDSIPSSDPLKVNKRVAPGATRLWNAVPGATNGARFSIEVLPAAGKSNCAALDNASMLDSVYGTFRIRATGEVGGVKRSIIGTFRKKGFTNFVYFTNSEGGSIRFTTGDEINGPLHTNDTLLICGTPKFGRKPSDTIETSMPGAGNSGEGWTGAGSCGGDAPQVNFPGVGTVNNTLGTWRKNSPTLQLPPSNQSLKTEAAAEYKFTGKTRIVLNGSTMTVTNSTVTTIALPAAPTPQIVYVSNGTCGASYTTANPYYDWSTAYGSGCGNVEVSGTYSGSLTIAADSDIVIRDDITRQAGTDVLLGLIANNWIRVWHPTSSGNRSCSASTTEFQPLGNVTVDAAILSLTQSFGVDNYTCGNKQGTLTVNGAIAQETRGAVGTGGASGTGYLKNYQYDDRLKYRSPPSFLEPTEAAWGLGSQQEQVPAQ